MIQAPPSAEKRSDVGRIRIGPAGWSYPDWEGVVYPRRKSAGFNHLSYLASYFDTIEINSTFYRHPRPSSSRIWAGRVSDRESFRFTVKLLGRFTHEDASPTGREAALFNMGLDPLRESGRLGALLIQFPWSFKNIEANRRRVASLCEAFRSDPLVVEVRHASWHTPEFYDFLADQRAGFVNVDQPLFRRSLEPSAHTTTPLGYVRLHGQNKDNWFRNDAGRDERYDYLYTPEELEPWVKKIMDISRRAETTYVITNNHFKGKAVCNALELKQMLLGFPVEVPEAMLTRYPNLGEIAANPPVQGNLF